MLFDRRGNDSLHADAVAAHDDRHFFALLVQHCRAHRLGILRAEFEDVTDLHAFENFEHAGFAPRTSFA